MNLLTYKPYSVQLFANEWTDDDTLALWTAYKSNARSAWNLDNLYDDLGSAIQAADEQYDVARASRPVAFVVCVFQTDDELGEMPEYVRGPIYHLRHLLPWNQPNR